MFKQQAAHRAVEYVELGMVVGLGTGSTVQYTIELIAALLKDGHLQDIRGILSSIHTEKLARTLGIPLTTFDEHPTIDITIDGADEVDQRQYKHPPPGLNQLIGRLKTTKL